jgi:hypothetical protein
MKRIIDFTVKYPVAITAVLCFVFYFLPFKPVPFGDLDQIHIGILDLFHYFLNGFQGTINIEKGFLTLFCYLIPYSLVYSFHNNQLFLISGIIFNCVFICFSIQLLFKAFDIMNFTKKAKFYSLLLLCLFPIHIYYAMGILGEAFGFFAIAAFVYIWIKINYSKEYGPKHFIYLGLSLVLLYGIKPNMIPFISVFIIYLFFSKYKITHKLIFGSVMVIIPLLILMEKELDKTDFRYKNTVFRNQILWSRFELRSEPFNWLPQHGRDGFESKDYLDNLEKRRELDSICDVNHYDKTKYFINWVKNDIINNPLLTIRQYSLKFFQSQSFIISPLMKSNKSSILKYGIHAYINLLNYILVITGLFSMYKLFRNKRYQLFIPFLLLWGWSLLYVFVFHSEQRYMFPTRPVLIFLFAYLVNESEFINNLLYKNKNVNS